VTASDERYTRALAHLLALPDYERGAGGAVGAVFTLERPRALLDALGRPQLARAVVLIAGSKGKGSTAALLEAILRAHGLRTLLYTQPHLHDYRERIRLDGRCIAPELFARLGERVARAAGRVARARPDLGLTTTYEQTTALAFLAAAERRVDWAVIEVGLGGRLDATNLSEPLVSVITPIGLEHRAILGDTLAAIAREKAAIVRAGRPAIAASQHPEALQVIRTHCASVGAALSVAPALGSPGVHASPSTLIAGAETPLPSFWTTSISTPMHRYDKLRLPLGGAFQVGNLCTALWALEALPGAERWLDPARVAAGVAGVRWPGRLEVARQAPLVVLDGAHTPESAAELVGALRLHFRYRRLTLVFACFADKDAERILDILGALGGRLVLTSTGQPRSRPVDDLDALARRLGIAAARAERVEQGLARALEEAAPDDAICVTGSLAAVAAARAALGLAGASSNPRPPRDASRGGR